MDNTVFLSRTRDAISYVLTSLEDGAPPSYEDGIYRAVRMLSFHMDRLFSFATKTELARSFLIAKIDWQENHICDLRSEVMALRSLPGNLPNILDVSILMNEGLSFRMISPNRLNRSPSTVRGEDVTPVQESILSQNSLPAVLSEDGCIGENPLVKEILRVEDSIARINSEITSKAACLLELDAAAESALANIATLDDRSDSWRELDRVGRARRRSEANRPRGGSTRTSSQTTLAMKMDNEYEINLPSQGFRSPSGRREDSTVPEVPPSLSGEGPASSLPTGEELEIATVAVEMDRDPLDLTFVDCLSAVEAVPQHQNSEITIASTPVVAGTKRKAKKISPDAPSEDEPGASTSGTQRIPRVVLRKLRSREKIKPKEADSPIEEVSSAQMSTDNEWNSESGRALKKRTLSWNLLGCSNSMRDRQGN
ncbi:hypothetical protein RF55_7681 [Lasius niger]|uniref:Uncharacterized protein n=1 Tax=Lasius niger TaxID=67767 RepID=A0A0J7KPR6_LASNI|nr:hypothetical protein RF55_7681 [Lasius niger]